jgi:phosphatidylglycerophosphatase A
LLFYSPPGGGTGYSPIASGTVGTLAAIPLYLLLVRLPILYYLLSLIPLTLFSCWVSGQAETIFNEKDSGKIVIDEVVGYLITMTGASTSWSSVILGFFLFRFFDIVKVPPANIIDRRLKTAAVSCWTMWWRVCMPARCSICC